MESIIDYLIRQLKGAGSRRWPLIAAEIASEIPGGEHVREPLLRKIAYLDRDNPGVMTVQPLLDYFHQVDRGERALPEPTEKVVA